MEEVATEKSLRHLKRSRSPSIETFPFKSQPCQDTPIKRKFLTKQGPGLVKTIWVLHDWEDTLAIESQIESDWFVAANGSQWRLTLCQSPEKLNLSIFLEANSILNSFPQDAHHTITIQVQKPNGKLEKILNKTSKDTFTAENCMIGHLRSILLSKLSAYPDKSLFITSTVKTAANREICKRTTGFVGLINEGTTCYMNSLLQTLFLITSFRKAVFSIPFSDSEEFKIPRALGKLFAGLQTSEKPLSTQDLLMSFGWARDKWHEQQDVQEFSYKFSDTMEKSMTGTLAEGTYSQLFKGVIVQKIQCVNVDYVSESSEEFIDLQLDVKGCGNIYNSLDKYVEPVLLKGEIQYDAEGYGKQDAIKVVKFKKLPSVLQIQLKRFEYNQNRGMMTKVNEKFEFYTEINLDPYTEEKDLIHKYRLFSILVHSGTLGKGHYSTFVSPTLSDKWFKFNDDTVDLALSSQAIESNWGGEIEDITLGDGGKIVYGKKKCEISAYMLVYIRISDIPLVLPPSSEISIPPQLLLSEKPIEYQRRDKKRNCRNSFLIAIASKETILGWEGAGIASIYSKPSFFTRIIRTADTLAGYFRSQLPVFTEYKLWTFTPGPANWNLSEANTSESVSAWAVGEEITKCVFVESKHKLLNGSSENWTWNDLETLNQNGKFEFNQVFVFIKKFENGKSKIAGCEWITENGVLEIRKKLFEKYFEQGPEGWMCLENSKSETIKIREIYSFVQLKSSLNHGDCLIIGYESIDAPLSLLKLYNTVTIEAVYHDQHSFFDNKSYSKELLEKCSFNAQIKIRIEHSCTLLTLMKEVYLNLNLPNISEKYIQILSPSFEPIKASNFSLSKVINHFKVYFDIVSFNVLEDILVHFCVLEFSSSFDLVRCFWCEARRRNLLSALKAKVMPNCQIFLFRYQQRAILKYLKDDDKITQLPGGVNFAIQPEKIERISNKLQVNGFHGFSIDQGTGKPFMFNFKKNVNCRDIKRKVSERLCCMPENIKVAKLDNEENPSCYKLVGDLDDTNEIFIKKHPNCSIFVEHKSQGMRFN